MAIPPIKPWEPVQIPLELQLEFNRRKKNRSFKYVDSAKGEWDNQTGEWTKYRGPITPWVRFCSNGLGREKDKKGNRLSEDQLKPGFVLFGGKDFYNEYGFSKRNITSNSNYQSVIGYLPDGKTPHLIDNDLRSSNHPIHVPSPEIEKISVTIQKELYRRASIDWVCFSKEQLEYMTPYFLIPGISCILEWGWNLYNPECLLDLTNIQQLKSFSCNPYPLYTDHILKSNGNYDVMIGRVTHFEWSADGNKFKCKTEITSQDRIYSGLVVDAKSEFRSKDEEEEESATSPFGSLLEFVNTAMPKFKEIGTITNPFDENNTLLYDIVSYIKEHHPSNWEEYIYGVFYGRDFEDLKTTDTYDNKHQDFDRKSQTSLWLNLGLIIECINKHCEPLKSLCGSEMFRIDIDDVVISAHPNLISCDGGVLLIPNSEAPKYSYGGYGISNPVENNKDSEKADSDYQILKNSSWVSNESVKKKNAVKLKRLYDYRVKSICLQGDGTYRDNLDELINRIRYENTVQRLGDNAFPIKNPQETPKDANKPYPAKFSGYLKDLYVNVEHFKKLVENKENIKTYSQLVERLMIDISNAAGGFWDFRLVSSTGSKTLKKGEPASMKIVDYNFISSINVGSPYTFDYYDSESLLLGFGFKPTLSNAQAIRTIYAQTNQPDRNVVLTNGDNELLDYMFKDRLAMDSYKTPPRIKSKKDSEHTATMRFLQQISPRDGSYQMTTKTDGKILIRRLVLPSPDVLKMLLDDGDEDQNPKYTGIMPGIQANFTIQGIGGLRTFMMFLVRNLPEPYSHENIIFRIIDVQEVIEAGKWITTITAGIIPLREHIKQRLGIPNKSG